MKTLTLVVLLLVGTGCVQAHFASLPPVPKNLKVAAPLLNKMAESVPSLSQAQAVLGAGSLLGLAKARMPTNEFAQVSRAIPGTDVLIGEAVRQGLPDRLNSAATLSGFLGPSGISPDMISRIVPVLGSAAVGNVDIEVLKGFLAAMQ